MSKSIIMTRKISNNLFSPNLKSQSGTAIDRYKIADNEYYIATPSQLGIQTPNNRLLFEGKENTQYSFSYLIKCTDGDGGSNVCLGVAYTDGSSEAIGIRGNYPEYTLLQGTTSAGKTVASIGLFYLGGEEVWLKDIMVVEGTTPMAFVPYGPIKQFKTIMYNKNIIPLEYEQLEYIESSGGKPYINTGLFIDTADALNDSEIVFAPTSLVVEGLSYTENPVICGVISTSGYVGYQAIISANTGTLGGSGCTYDKSKVAVNEKVIVKLTAGNGIPNRYFILFGKNQGAPDQTTISASSKASGRLYSAKIMYKGSLALNLVPAKRKTDNIVGLYDTITNTFFTNEGTGDFIPGGTINTIHEALVSVKGVTE